MLSINFIGCGRLGKTIGRLITKNRLGNVSGILNTSLESGNAAAKFIGSGTSYLAMPKLPTANLYIIATRDDLIESTCNQLIRETDIAKGSIIVHCSGSLTSDVLQASRKVGAYAMSVHPIKSFANPEVCVENFSGTYCAYEGDQEALPTISNLFTGIGGILFPIHKNQKTLYHAAGVIANNYLVGLHHTAHACYKLAGVDDQIAYKVATMLMNDALQNLQLSTHNKALTGPLQRGDVAVIKKHLSSLSIAPHIKSVYSQLGRATLPVTNHADDQKINLDALFQEKDFTPPIPKKNPAIA